MDAPAPVDWRPSPSVDRCRAAGPLAFFSDVHGNLPGLRAVLADIDARPGVAALCLGDLVGYGPHPNDVVGLLHELHIPTLMGNYDRGIGLESGECGCVYVTDDQKAEGAASLAWTTGAVTAATRDRLRSLGGHLLIDTPVGLLLAVHASPRRLNEYLFEDRPETSLRRLVGEAELEMGIPLRAIIFGHTHVPYVRDVPHPTDDRTVTFINDGSAGRPRDGDWRSCYALIDPGFGEAGTLGVSFVRVPYDHAALQAALAGTSLITTFQGPGNDALEGSPSSEQGVLDEA
jgi:predicted phosphodiesterase